MPIGATLFAGSWGVPMGLLQRLEIRQGQSLVMTPQLLQAIKLLQLSHLDLAAYVEAELERNPLLERAEAEAATSTAQARPRRPRPSEATALPARPRRLAERPRPAPRPSSSGEPGRAARQRLPTRPRCPARDAATGRRRLTLAASPWSGGGGGGLRRRRRRTSRRPLASEVGLHEHLEAQLDLATRDPADRLIGRHLIDRHRRGRLSDRRPSTPSPSGSAPSSSAVERVLRLVQSFEPPGIGARNLAECLAIQLRERDRLRSRHAGASSRISTSWRSAIFAALKRLCGVDDEDLADMLAEIRAARPEARPRLRRRARSQVLVPDVIVRPAPDGELDRRAQSGHAAAGAGQPDLLRQGLATRAKDEPTRPS